MKFIDITTSHNISIRFELAETSMRLLATIIDVAIMGLYMMLASAIVGLLGDATSVSYLLISLPVTVYHLFFEILFNGQSPGKKILKLKVVTLEGRSAESKDYLLRWLFRPIDITFSLGSLALIFVSSTKKNQRIGDILAQTTVIKVKTDKKFDLKSLVNFADQNREIEYPKIAMYEDEDMMLVKDSILRLKRFPNDENKTFVIKLIDRIKADLDIPSKEKKGIKFLEQVLREYIVITR